MIGVPKPSSKPSSVRLTACRFGTLAVGVETEEQLAFLRALGCEDAQGYLFSLPLEAAAVRQRMESETQNAP